MVLAALEVLGQHVEQLLGGELLLAVDDRVDGGHGVSGVADADGEGAGLTVAGAAALQGLALLHAVVDEHGREHHGLTHGVQGADDVEAANHQIHEVVDLGVKRLLQLLEGVQLGELAGLGAELLAVDGVDAVVHHQLNALEHVDVADSGTAVGSSRRRRAGRSRGYPSCGPPRWSSRSSP